MKTSAICTNIWAAVALHDNPAFCRFMVLFWFFFFVVALFRRGRA